MTEIERIAARLTELKQQRGRKTAQQYLEELVQLHAERGERYTDDYKRRGSSLLPMFPDGLTLKTPEDFNRFAILVHIHGKLMRYANMFGKGGCADSLRDIAVYAMLLQELDSD